MLDYNIRMQIAEKGWYLLSVPSKMTWSDAVTYWNMQDCDIYEYIHELKTEPVLHGNNVEREDWEKIHIQSNIILLPHKAYWVLVEKVHVMPLIADDVPSDSHAFELSFYMVARGTSDVNTTKVSYKVGEEDVLLALVTPTSTWTLYRYAVTTLKSAASLNLKFENVVENGDNTNAIANIRLTRNNINYITNGEFTLPAYNSTYSTLRRQYVYYPKEVHIPLTNWSGRYVIVKDRRQWRFPSSNDAVIVSLQNVDAGLLEQNVTLLPVITLIGASEITLEKGSNYVELGAETEAGESVVIDSSALEMNTTGTYYVVYSATDAKGNTVTATRTIIVEDTTPENLHSLHTTFALEQKMLTIGLCDQKTLARTKCVKSFTLLLQTNPMTRHLLLSAKTMTSY